MGMSLGAIIIAAFLSILLFVSYVSRPDIAVVKGVPVITQGLLVPAILIGVVIWGLVEYSTPPGKGIVDLVARFIVAFVVGGFVGGYLGYEFSFGAYVLTPAFSGNMYAEFFLIITFLAVFSLIWTVAWAHTHGFKGIKSSGARALNFSESGPSKVKRIMIAFIGIIVVFMFLVPAGAELGHIAAQGQQVDTLGYKPVSPYNNALLYSSTQIYSVREFNASSSISSVTTIVYGVASEFEMPTHDVKNATGVEVPEFYQTAYMTSALTTGNVNQYAISKISLHFPSKITANITIGTGVAVKSVAGETVGSTGTTGAAVALPSTTTTTKFVGTNATTFVPVESVHMNDSAYANFTLSPSMFLGNQSLSISYEIHGNLTSEIEVIPVYTGNPSSLKIFWPYNIIRAMYVVGGILLLVFIPLSIPMVDLNTKSITVMGGKKGGKTKR
ncbi:MAG: hypothetical protein QXZ17_00045 [Nitrososphaerota archaeon]